MLDTLLAALLTVGQLLVDAASEPALPLENGFVRVTERIGADGGAECQRTMSSPAFEAVGAALCGHVPVRTQDDPPLAGVSAQISISVSLALEGQPVPTMELPPGKLVTVERVALTVTRDGVVSGCQRLYRFDEYPDDRGAARPWGDGVCSALRRSGARAFSPAPDGAEHRVTLIAQAHHDLPLLPAR